MANWLEAIGRTNAVGSFVGNAMQPMIQLEGLKLQQQRQNMLAQHQAKQNMLMDEQIKVMERQRKEAESFVPVSAVAPQLSGFPELSKHWEEAVKQSGFIVKEIAGEKFVQRGGINSLMQLMNTNVDFARKSLDLTKMGVEKQLVDINRLLSDPENKPSGKELEGLQERQKSLRDQMAGLIQADLEFNKQLAVAAMKQKPPSYTEAEMAGGLAGEVPRKTYIETKKAIQKPTEGAKSQIEKDLIAVHGQEWFNKATPKQKKQAIIDLRRATAKERVSKPSTWDKEWAIATREANRETMKNEGRKATETEIAKKLKELFPRSAESFLSVLLGGHTNDPLGLGE